MKGYDFLNPASDVLRCACGDSYKIVSKNRLYSSGVCERCGSCKLFQTVLVRQKVLKNGGETNETA